SLPLMLCWHVHHLFSPHGPACYHRLQRLRLLLLGATLAMGTRLHRFLSALHLFIHQAILSDADEKVRPRRFTGTHERKVIAAPIADVNPLHSRRRRANRGHRSLPDLGFVVPLGPLLAAFLLGSGLTQKRFLMQHSYHLLAHRLD